METVKDLKDRILTELGHPILKVELADQQLSVAVEDAMRWYNSKKAVLDELALTVTGNVNEYLLEPQVLDVWDVVRSGYRLGFYEDVVGQMGWPQNYFPFMTRGSFSAIVQELQYLESRNRVIGRDKDWFFTPNHGTGKKGLLRLFPMPSEAENIIVFYRKRLSTDLLSYLNPIDEDMIIRYACARGKFLLGRIRSKYDSLPAAQGDRMLDGATLIDEANTEIDALNTEIMDSQEPIFFLTG